jgi:hypothetical protein
VQLYRFADYAARRDAARAASRVSELRGRLAEPGAAAELKARVASYLAARDAARRAA